MIYAPSLLLLLLASVHARVPSTDIDLAALDRNGISALTVQGAEASDNLGSSVSTAGDVNGDGYADVIVGALYADPNDRLNAGAAYVFFGYSNGSATLDTLNFMSGNSTGFIIQGAVAGDILGNSVSGAGDVNGDGFDDVIVGARHADPNDRSYAGAAYVIMGRANGFTALDLLSFTSGTAGFIIQGGGEYYRLGESVSGAGDVNGDSYDDVIVGAYGPDENAGAAYVIMGKASGFVTLDMLGFTSSDSTGFII
jgi:hypothetical protein